jgi:hypothetical protein
LTEVCIRPDVTVAGSEVVQIDNESVSIGAAAI